MTTSRPHKLYPINHLLFQGNRVNRDEGNGCIPFLDRSIALFISQSSGQSLLFGVSEYYDQSPLRRMLVTDSAQSFLPMIRRLIQPEVWVYTPSQAGGHSGIQVAVTNRQTEMSAREGRQVTRAEAHSDLGHAGIQVAVTNRQIAMSAREGRQVTRSEAHSAFSSNAANRRVETQHEYSNRLKRFPKTLSEAGRISGNARAIDDDRVLCRTAGCQNRQLTASNPLCKTCVTKKNKRKREEDEESGARICAECRKEIVGKITKGCCNPCYQKQHRKTGRVIDPAMKLCTHASGCQNKRYRGGLCERHHRNRHLDASADSECAASASAATAPKKRRPKKARNGKKKTKKKKPVVINENGKTVGLTSVHYEDEEVEVDSDDDDDDWDEEY